MVRKSSKEMTTKEFIESTLRNSYITEDTVTIYLRKSMRLIEGRILPCIDIANISVGEQSRGKRVFTNYMKMLVEDYGKENNLYVESILNSVIIPTLERLEFIRLTSQEDINMIRFKDNDNGTFKR